MADSDRQSLVRRFAAWFSGGLGVLVALSLSASSWADEAGWEAAKRPGAVLLMRHALAPGTGDPANLEIGDCSTQRNLSDAGREQAARIGQAFRDRGIAVDPVLTSQWCRCRETAELLDLGPVEAFPALNSFFGDRSTEPAQTHEALDFLSGLSDDRRPFLVTHQVNISALAGTSTRSGEVVVVDVTPEGDVEILGRILIDP
jgi:phosphohistidine phosphatase SixA